MSLGNPVVSTSIGAEGIEYTAEENILIDDEPKGFADDIVRLLSDHLLFGVVRENALKLVQARYDWGKIGARLTERLNDVLQKGNAS